MVIKKHVKAEIHEYLDDRQEYLKLPDGVSILPFKLAGVIRFDIIPYALTMSNDYAKAGDLWHEKTFYIHRNIGVEKATVVCPKSIGPDRRCPICDFIRAKRNDWDAIRDILPQERQLYNVIKAGEPDKMYIINQAYETLGALLDEHVDNADPDEHFEFFTDPDTWTEEDAAVYGEEIVVGTPKGMTVKLLLKKKTIENRREVMYVSSVYFKARKYTTRQLVTKTANLDELLIIHSFDCLSNMIGDFDSEARDFPVLIKW
jgi:hypothetical protein